MRVCLDEPTILALVSGALAPARRGEVDAHLAACDACRRRFAWARELAHEATAAGGEVLASSATEAAPGTPASPVHVGQVLAGRYRVERVLGVGGMGVVVAARHLALDQRFAIKFLLPAAYEASGAVARFLREGKAAARITSEHVARVFDTGVLDSGAPYLVMEHLEGADLGDVVTRRGRLAPGEAIECVLQACEAIAEAHQLGIVHRDLKPANLFLTQRKDGTPFVKVLDFGISKSESGSRRDLTSTSAVMGSPRYMSPEQMLSTKHVDARTDVWALGVILHELVTGAPVWDAETLQGLCVLVTTAPAPPLRSIVPDAPEALERAILGCLAKSPAHRIADVGVLALALAPAAPERARTSIERVVGTLGRSAPAAFAPLPSLAATVAASPTGASPTGLDAAMTVAPSPPRARTALVAVAVAVALASALLGARFFGSAPAPPRVTASTPPSASAPPIASIAGPAEPLPAPSSEPAPPVAIEAPAPAPRPRARPEPAPRPRPAAPPPATAGAPGGPDSRAVDERK
jgi:serine/threonine-protein kinase